MSAFSFCGRISVSELGTFAGCSSSSSVAFKQRSWSCSQQKCPAPKHWEEFIKKARSSWKGGFKWASWFKRPQKLRALQTSACGRCRRAHVVAHRSTDFLFAYACGAVAWSALSTIRTLPCLFLKFRMFQAQKWIATKGKWNFIS